MTYLQQLIDRTVKATVGLFIKRRADDYGEEFAKELFQDKAFKEEILQLAREAARHAVAEMKKERKDNDRL